MQKAKKKRRYRIKPEKPALKEGFNYQVWRVVDGAIRDAFLNHPDYLTKKGSRSACARRSIAKRVSGALLSYLAQSGTISLDKAFGSRSAKQGRSGERPGVCKW